LNYVNNLTASNVQDNVVLNDSMVDEQRTLNASTLDCDPILEDSSATTSSAIDSLGNISTSLAPTAVPPYDSWQATLDAPDVPVDTTMSDLSAPTDLITPDSNGGTDNEIIC